MRESRDQILVALGKTVPDEDALKKAEYQRELEEYSGKAKEAEADSHAWLRTHEISAASVTLFQVAIALAL